MLSLEYNLFVLKMVTFENVDFLGRLLKGRFFFFELMYNHKVTMIDVVFHCHPN